MISEPTVGAYATAKSNLPGPAQLALLALIWALIYVPGLFHPALLDDADSVHAECAREMVQRGDWVTLHADGIRYLEKAPLMYWSVAASFKVFGVHDWSARLPLALAALALVFAVYALGRNSFGPNGGFFSALALATSIGPYLFTRFLIPDLIIALWLTLTFLLFLRSLSQSHPGRSVCWGMAACCALNVLTKGLIGLVFPVGAIVLYLGVTRDLGHLRKLRLASSALVFFLIAAPWHVMAALRNPSQGKLHGFLWFYFVNEHFLRYLNRRVPRDYDTVPLLLFWSLLLVWVFPWSAFLPPALVSAARGLRRRGMFRFAPTDASQRANLLLAIWAFVVVGFFSFSTRQEYYVLPAAPALALLVGGWLAREPAQPALGRAGKVSAGVLAIVGASAMAVALFLSAGAKAPSPYADLAELLSKNPQDYALSLGHVLDLTPEALGRFRGLMLGLAGCLFVGGVAAWWLRRKQRWFAANLLLALAMAGVLFCVHRGLTAFEPILSSRDLAAAISQRYRPGDVIVIDGDYEDGSTLNYYTGQQVHMLNHREADLWYGSFFPDAPQVFETNDSFVRLWEGRSRVFLWSESPHPELLNSMPVFEIARRGGKSILSNRGE